MSDCSFHQICIVFKKGACMMENIDKGECQGPLVKGVKICCVAKINNGTYKIAIISQCKVCEKIWGIVNGDTEPIPYHPKSIDLPANKRVKIPYSVCKTCLSTKNYVFSEAIATA